MRHVVDDLLVDVVDVLARRLPGVAAEVVVGPVAARHADDGHLQLAAPHEVVERREQLALGQVAGRAEQDEGVGRRLLPIAASLIGTLSLRSTWPPKPARIADSTLSATSDRPRELNRWNSAADSTGTGTPSSIAAAIVQRPSPESLTRPSNASRCGSTASAWAVRSSSQLDDDRPPPPHLGDRGEVEVVAVVLGVRQRRRLGVGDVRLGADVGLGEHVEALGVGGHQPVLDAVVDHLDEVPGAGRAAVQPAPLGRRRRVADAQPFGRALGGVDARGEGVEDRRQPLDGARRGRRSSGSSRARGRACRRSRRRRRSRCRGRRRAEPPGGCRRGTTSCHRR